jgi:tetratricopeptide (TPR) repeat protein
LSGDTGQGGGKIQTVGTDNIAAYDAYLQGMQQWNMGTYTSLVLAEMSFKQALVLDPDFFEARLELAFNYAMQANTGEITIVDAIDKLKPLVDRLREERPDNGLVLLAAFTVENFRARRLGWGAIDVDKRLAQLNATIERTPNEPRLYLVMAGLSRRANRLEESLDWLDRGFAVDPLNWHLYVSLGNHLTSAGDFDGAEAAYARAIELNPDNPNLLALLNEVHWQRKQYAQWFATVRKSMDLDPLDAEIPVYISMALYDFGLIVEADKYLQRAITIDPDHAFVRKASLYLLLPHDQARARDMSEAMLRDDIVSRNGAYGLAAMVFVSTMTELGETDQALAVLEELRPGVTSPDFEPQNIKQQVLQFAAVLVLAQSQSREETQQLLDAIVPRWDQSFPRWRQGSGREAAIEMARGETKLAIEQALKDLSVKNLVDAEEAVIYKHLYLWKALAEQPAVAARLRELDVEMKKGGEDIWDYIVAHDLQL